MANVSKEELLHIAKLADLNIKEDEVDNYLFVFIFLPIIKPCIDSC